MAGFFVFNKLACSRLPFGADLGREAAARGASQLTISLRRIAPSRWPLEEAVGESDRHCRWEDEQADGSDLFATPSATELPPDLVSQTPEPLMEGFDEVLEDAG